MAGIHNALAGAFLGSASGGSIFTGSGGTFTIVANVQNLNVRSIALAAGWNGTDPVVCTIASGVYIWSDDTSLAALTTGSPFPGGLTIINNGTIVGRGGNGDSYSKSGSVYTLTQATNGGPAISVGVNCTIQNNGSIAGGGGGGVSERNANTYIGGGGGGAGGGVGGQAYWSYSDGYQFGEVFAPGAAGGTVGLSGSNGSINTLAMSGLYVGGVGFYGYFTANLGGGGGGGRVVPGTGGSGGNASSLSDVNGKGGGSGGGGGSWRWEGYFGPSGLSGTAGGSAGSVGVNSTGVSRWTGGGGWGAGGGAITGAFPVAGTAGGRAVSQNGFTVTWTATGTRYGAIV